MSKRILALLLCLVLFICVIPAAAFAEEDYDTIVIQKGDTVKKLLEANKLNYNTEKYVVMVLNHMDREKQMEILSIGDTIKIPKSPADIDGLAPHLISTKDKIEFYVIPYSVVKGDTLKYIYKLWGLNYDDYAKAIKALNPDKDLEKLYAGNIIYLPTTEKNLHTKIYTTVMSHVMLQEEDVASVYSRYGMDFDARREEFQRYNLKDFDELKAGDKLMIPLIWE